MATRKEVNRFLTTQPPLPGQLISINTASKPNKECQKKATASARMANREPKGKKKMPVQAQPNVIISMRQRQPHLPRQVCLSRTGLASMTRKGPGNNDRPTGAMTPTNKETSTPTQWPKPFSCPQTPRSFDSSTCERVGKMLR